MVIAAGTVHANGSTRRERLLGWPGRQLDRVRGMAPACDGAVTSTFLSAIAVLDDAAGQCLACDPVDEGYILVPGPRKFRGRCARTVGARVNMLRGDSFALAARIGALVTGREIVSPRDGLATVARTSGAMLLTVSAVLPPPSCWICKLRLRFRGDLHGRCQRKSIGSAVWRPLGLWSFWRLRKRSGDGRTRQRVGWLPIHGFRVSR